MQQSDSNSVHGNSTPLRGAGTKVGLVTDIGRIDDGTFNQYAYQGLRRAAQEFGLTAAHIETTRAEEAEANILTLIADGCEMMVVLGRSLDEAIERIAIDHPKVHFITVDFTPLKSAPNITSLLFAEDQAGFLAGALAGRMTRSNVLGVIGGEEIPPVVKYYKGFANGAKFTNPKVKVIGEYVGSFTDPDKGSSVAQKLVQQGADIVFTPAGQTGAGAILKAAELGAWVIGVDQDEWFTTFQNGTVPGADRLLSSAMKRVDNAVYSAIRQVYSGKSQFTQTTTCDVTNDGVSLAPFHATADLVPEDVKGRLDEIASGLKGGAIRTHVGPGGEDIVTSFFDQLRSWNWTEAAVLVLAVFTAVLIGAIIIWVTQASELRNAGESWAKVIPEANKLVLAAYGGLFSGAIGSPSALAGTVIYATPYIFAGLAVALGFQCGLFNIGAEGQLYLGTLAATFVGFSVHGLPVYIHLPLVILAGILGGALWGAIPGFLKATTGAHEVINTIMMNYIAVKTVDYLVKGPLRDPGASLDRTPFVEASATYPLLFPKYGVSSVIIVALLAIIFVWWFLFKTTWGFEIRTVGANPSAARYAGMSVARNFVLAMAVSGALAGLAGVSIVEGRPSEYALKAAFSSGFGFDSIAVALLAKSHPFGILPAALLWGALRNGAGLMQVRAQNISIDLVNIIQGLVIMFIAADQIIRWLYRLRKRRGGAVVFTRGWGS